MLYYFLLPKIHISINIPLCGLLLPKQEGTDSVFVIWLESLLRPSGLVADSVNLSNLFTASVSGINVTA